jgi:dimethylargininase
LNCHLNDAIQTAVLLPHFPQGAAGAKAATPPLNRLELELPMHDDDHSRLTRAIVRVPGASFVSGLTTARLGAPDYQRALRQHASYCEALRLGGLDLTRLKADERYPDSTFVEDTAVMINTAAAAPPIAVLTRPGAASRTGEVESIKDALAQYCSGMHSIQTPGTLDGGDVCEAGSHFFIGISERTNEEGAQQLSGLLTSYGYTSSCVDIRSVKNILHFKSGVAYLDSNRLVVVDALARRKDFQGFELVCLDADEEYAANCVRVNDLVLIAAGYPKFERTLRDLGYKTIALEMTEFQKMDGGLSCLSLRS